MNRTELEKFLYDNYVYNSFQFFVNTRKTLNIAVYCKELIISLISKMETENSEYKKQLFNRFNEQEGNIKKVSVNYCDLPKYEISICDVDVSAPFLLDKLIKDFFQYVRNAFDCIAQAVNSACLANKSICIERADFSSIKRLILDTTYSADFPHISAWFSDIAESEEFKYIQDFNNRTKHICDVYIKLSMAIIGENETAISPFYKKNTQYEKQDIIDYLTAIYEFVSNAYSNFMEAVKLEIVKQKYVENRYQTLNIYQQIIKDGNSFSLPYIETSLTYDALPDAIYVLLVNEIDGEILSKNCPVKKILFKQKETDNVYICEYTAEASNSEDTLLEYRKYVKGDTNLELQPVLHLIMNEEGFKDTFYHKNAFMNIETVSDDESFLKRVNLPF